MGSILGSGSSRRILGGVPNPPGILRALVLAIGSLVEDLLPFALGNMVFGLGLLLSAVAAQASLLGNLAFVLLSLPAATVMRMACIHLRRGTARFRDLREISEAPVVVLVVAGVQLLALLLLALDMALGLAMGTLPGAALAMASFWLAVAVWTLAVIVWPILLDPEREDLSVRARLQLAGRVAIAAPLRAVGLALMVAIVLALATASVAVILGVGWALACLIAAHTVLPLADRLEGRRVEVEE
jgi:hypothetical protein